MKSHLRGHEKKIFVMDFFGSKSVRNSGIPGLQMKRILTAYGSQWNNTYLGYFIDRAQHSVLSSKALHKKQQGVVWGKDAKHLSGSEKLLEALASDTELDVTLYSTASSAVLKMPILSTGHLDPTKWHELLAESKFLIGMGNPILGPSAIDAISMGCLFIDPIYQKGSRSVCKKSSNGNCYNSQHPFAVERIGQPYVCSYREHNSVELKHCIKLALKTTLQPMIPKELEKEEYVRRVKYIFSLT